MRRTAWITIAAVGTLANSATGLADRPWKAAMERFEAIDRTSTRPAGGVVFVGSSSIRLWNLESSFGPDSPTPLLGPLINRGFGGSQIEDSVREIALLVARHQPRQVVLYAGDNDIAGGKSAETVVADFRRFVAAVHDRLPHAKIAFIAIKPSLSRWSLAETMRDANQRIQMVCDGDPRIEYIDVWAPMLDKTGAPRRQLFVDDGLHLSAAGYRLWADCVAGALDAPTD